MNNKKIPYLCGGTFFFLLVQAKKGRTNARERVKGIKNGLKDSDMMENLVQTFTNEHIPAWGKSIQKDTSDFRECRIDGSACIPFNNPSKVSSYDSEIKEHYNASLSRMINFSDNFLSNAMATWLGRVLLEVIEKDQGITADARFYAQSDGSCLSKSDLCNAKSIELQPLLTGILHYILMNRTDNKSGQPTLEAWGTKAYRAERKPKNNFSLGSSKQANVLWCMPEQHADNHNDEVSDTNKKTERIDPEVLDEPHTEKKGSEAKPVTVIHQQTNVVQNGDNNINLVVNGTLNLEL